MILLESGGYLHCFTFELSINSAVIRETTQYHMTDPPQRSYYQKKDKSGETKNKTMEAHKSYFTNLSPNDSLSCDTNQDRWVGNL